MYASPNIIRVIKSRRMTWKVHVACMGEMRNAYNILVGKLEGKRPLGSPRSRREDNIKMDLGKYGRKVRAECTSRNTVMNLRVP